MVENDRNKQIRSLAVPQHRENALAAVDSKQQEHATQFDLAGIGDSNYAIAENLVEQSRREHKGNWVEDKHNLFSGEHASLVECEKDDEWSDDDNHDNVDDNMACCQGVCASLIRSVQPRFNELKDECLALLRMLRATRREKGYIPLHGLLLVCSADGSADDLLEVHLLGQVSFAPFDFTSVLMRPAARPSPDDDTVAEIVVVDGTAVLQSMSKVLHGLASRLDIRLGTASYKAVGLGSVRIISGTKQSLAQLQAGVHGVAGMARQGGEEVHTSDEDHELGRRQGLLKRALGLVQPKKKAKPSAARNRAAAAPGLRKRSNNTEHSTAMSASAPTADKQTDNEIEERWAEALEADLGIILPAPSQPAEAASSSRSVPDQHATSALACPQPDQLNMPSQVPWKAADGHVFAMVQRDGNELRKKHLGSLAWSTNAQLLFLRSSCFLRVTIVTID